MLIEVILADEYPEAGYDVGNHDDLNEKPKHAYEKWIFNDSYSIIDRKPLKNQFLKYVSHVLNLTSFRYLNDRRVGYRIV